MRMQRDGSYAKPETLIYDPKIFPSCDGICYYPQKNWVIITDSERNAVRYWDIKAGTLGLLWENGDTDGADGLLDQPCEPMVWGDKLIVVNFDMKFPGLLNTVNDNVHTVSVIDLGTGGSLPEPVQAAMRLLTAGKTAPATGAAGAIAGVALVYRGARVVVTDLIRYG